MIAGFDPSLGVRDFCALAFVAQEHDTFVVRHLARWKPTDEHDLLRRLDDELAHHHVDALVFDASGTVGQKVRPLIVESPAFSRLPLFPVVTRPLLRAARQVEDGTIQTPKRMLVDALFSLIPAGRLQCPRSLPLASVLLEEFRHFRSWQAESGLTMFGAERGFHDDLVSAVALAIFVLQHQETAGTVNRWRPINGDLSALRFQRRASEGLPDRSV